MAIRKIIKIDETKCDGCGLCIVDCAEGALKLVDGKARVVKDSYCDGLGACLGACPVDALTIVEREADVFDEEAVEEHLAATAKPQPVAMPVLQGGGGCPGAAMRQMERPAQRPSLSAPSCAVADDTPSQLRHWPIQLTLVPPGAPFLQGADLLLAADCVPFALPDFHARFLQGHSVVVGCPKLDNPQAYVDKLTAIFQQSSLGSLTIVHMEVPCCTGLCQIAKLAKENAHSDVVIREVTVSVDGRVIDERQWGD